MAFPLWTNNAPAGATYPIEVTLASLALPEFSGVTGFAGTKVIHSSAIMAQVNGVLVSLLPLTSLAIQTGSDWYRWRGLATADMVLSGVCSWAMEGLTDIVEWTHTDETITTRVMRGPWLEHDGESFTLGPDGSSSLGDGVPVWVVSNICPEFTDIDVDLSNGDVTGILPVDSGGTGSDLSGTGPGVMLQTAPGAPLTVGAIDLGDPTMVTGTLDGGTF